MCNNKIPASIVHNAKELIKCPIGDYKGISVDVEMSIRILKHAILQILPDLAIVEILPENKK